MRKVVIVSVLFHATVMAVSYFGVPFLRRTPSLTDAPILVEIVASQCRDMGVLRVLVMLFVQRQRTQDRLEAIDSLDDASLTDSEQVEIAVAVEIDTVGTEGTG